MKRLSGISVLFLLLVAISCNSIFTSKEDQLRKVISSEEVTYVDVRTPKEYKEGSLPYAVNIPLDSIQKSLTFFEAKPNQSYVLFCRSGNRAGKAIKILKKNKIKKVYNGISASHIKAIKNE